MTIIACKAVSYGQMQRFASRDPECEITKFAEQFDKCWVISITDPDVPPIFQHETNFILPLQFDDVDPTILSSGNALENLKHEIFMRKMEENCQLFSASQARKICRFIRNANDSNPDSMDVLIVNCMAGVSRSGAITDFTRSVYGIDNVLFRRMNPQIRPNRFVKRWLFSVWHEADQQL